MTTAPSYTRAGYYNVYYKITYSYSGERMEENGVSNVWLLEDSQNNQSDNAPEIPHVHDYRYVETVAPSCIDLGFEHWQCDGCGRLEKRNYTPAKGHSYEDITIREASCTQGGLVLTICKNCGDFHQTTTPTGTHSYKTHTHNGGILLVLAFLISPFGLPALITWLSAKMNNLKYSLSNFITS